MAIFVKAFGLVLFVCAISANPLNEQQADSKINSLTFDGSTLSEEASVVTGDDSLTRSKRKFCFALREVKNIFIRKQNY